MKSKLTSKDKLVLWGLTEYPDLKDNKLSKKLGVKRRTFGAVKTKLKKNGVFSTSIFPDFNALGCEILTICYGSSNPLIKLEDREEDIQKIRECEEIVHVCATEREFLTVSLSKNFTEFRKKASEILRLHEQKNFLENVTSVHFPLGISRYQFFELSGLIKTHFGLNVECEKKSPHEAFNRVRLTKKEKKVLYALVKMPDAKNEEIRSRTGITTHTVSRIKKKFLDKGIIDLRRLPVFEVLGCELLAFTHVKYRADKGNEDERQASEIFRISSDADSASFSLFKDYTAYKDYYDKKLGYLRNNDLIGEEPGVMLFPVQKLKYVKNFSFAPLVKKVLEVDAEF